MKKNVLIIAATVAVTLLIVGVIIGVSLFVYSKSQQLANFPFNVKYRKAILGSGYVDRIENKTDKPQPVKVMLNNPTFNRSKTYSIVVDAHQFKEIGHLEGWEASSGDQITLECNGVSEQFSIP